MGKLELAKTTDPYVFIEAVDYESNYTRYRMVTEANNPTSQPVRRWEVIGVCDYRGNCLIGAVLDDGTIIQDHEHLRQLSDNGKIRLISELDVPVTPEFSGCCPFTYNELNI